MFNDYRKLSGGGSGVLCGATPGGGFVKTVCQEEAVSFPTLQASLLRLRDKVGCLGGLVHGMAERLRLPLQTEGLEPVAPPHPMLVGERIGFVSEIADMADTIHKALMSVGAELEQL